MNYMEILNRSQRYNQILVPITQQFAIFMLVMTLLRYIFFFLSRYKFEIIDSVDIVNAFVIGLRFDLLVLGFFAIPLVTILPGILFFNFSEIKISFLIKLYLSAVSLIILFSSYISLPHYLMSERHFRWAQDSVFVSWPLVGMGVYVLVHLIFLFLLLGCLKSVWGRDYLRWAGGWPQAWSPSLKLFVAYLLPLFIVALAARGTLGARHLELAHSEISVWPHVNELALNAVWCFDK